MDTNKEVVVAVCRVWKSGKYKTPILLFPECVDRRTYTIQMYEEVGQHGFGDHYGVVQQTRLATDEEAAKMAKHYENYYDCKIKLKKRLRVDWSQPLEFKNLNKQLLLNL